MSICVLHDSVYHTSPYMVYICLLYKTVTLFMEVILIFFASTQQFHPRYMYAAEGCTGMHPEMCTRIFTATLKGRTWKQRTCHCELKRALHSSENEQL